MIHHLTIRVPWHDSKWSGKVCEDPESNVFCSTLKRIRETKKLRGATLFREKLE
ncbi:hypothetical protein SAMN06272722_11179 [Paenibacillus sp. RU5A]|nr:hypothetical protein SAMN06272722_11179 [Paenibacillus sp. RU5A]SOC74734.1 hypothetical protein SAMN05880581_11179 [Paenibacillus sp. RU26A]SOC76867.1 hypothetical protein SAMN05880586_11179 [Paenibacillus sp. RU5M]